MKYLSYIFVALGAIFKAIADTLYHHFSISIFKNLDSHYWNPTVSWEYIKVIKFTGYRPDAWHLANSSLIFSFILAIVFYQILIKKRIYDFLALGILFNLIFNLFYNHILI